MDKSLQLMSYATKAPHNSYDAHAMDIPTYPM